VLNVLDGSRAAVSRDGQGARDAVGQGARGSTSGDELQKLAAALVLHGSPSLKKLPSP